MTLIDNPFAVLGAMPADDRMTLTNKADEAALLGGEDTEAALNQLMQMNRRIPAELAWLPGAGGAAVNAFTAYARLLSKEKPARVPPMDGIGTALAQANGLSPLFERWPADNPVLFEGLCRAMDGVLSRVTVKDTLRAINADRRAGGWEPVPDEQALAGPLNDRLRELCAPVGQAMAKLNDHDAAAALRLLLDSENGIDAQGSVGQAITDAYSMRILERTDKLKGEIIAGTVRLGQSASVSTQELQGLQGKAETWCDLTAPLRQSAGPLRNDAKAIGHGIRNALVNYVNKAGAVRKKENVYVPAANGVRTVTIEYNSQSDTVKWALEFNKWLVNMFPEQLELQAQLQQDDAQLNQLLKNEYSMLERARMQAYSR